MSKLTPKEVAPYRAKLWLQQNKTCFLCNRYIAKPQTALDHDHKTGHVRSVLHRNCNSLEGRILSFARRSGIEPKEFLNRLIEYWGQDYTDNPLHPNHTSDTQKRLKEYRKKLKAAKRETTKLKYRKLIKELKESL